MQSTRLPKTNYRDPKRWNTVSVPERVAERADICLKARTSSRATRMPGVANVEHAQASDLCVRSAECQCDATT